MRNIHTHRSALSSVLLFSSGIVLGGASMAAGFFLANAREAFEPSAHESSARLEPVAGLAVEPVAAETGLPADTAEPAPDAPSSPDAPSVIERALGFAVSVRAGPSYGAGALVGEGAVLTALHVVEDRPTPQVRFHDGEWAEARVLVVDEHADLALLEVDAGGRAPAPIGSALDVSIGDSLVTVGTPRELSFTVHRGDVTYVGRRFGGVRYVQTDLPANPGSSGGPVVDDEGRLIGVMSFILRGSEGIAFVTPLDYAAGLFERAEVPLAALGGSSSAFAQWRDDNAR